MAWQIDPAHSMIQFSVRHMMISTVRGQFKEFSGTIDFDENDPSNAVIEVEVQVASIDTGDQQRDEHLRSPDFFDAANFPTMSFKSTRIEKIDANHGRVIGDLTIKGTTNEIVLETEYAGVAKSPWGTTNAGASTSGKLSRKDWDLTWNQALETGGVLVGDEIEIEIELEMIKEEQAA